MNHVLSWERIAKKEGKEEGRIEVLHTIAVELLKNGIDIDIIAKVTHLTKKEIEELAAKSNNT
ncbi:MAG: hypothetical protein ACM3SY_18070 [Candidatus Omnitrophota bacterium]